MINMEQHGPRFGFKPPHVVSATMRIPGWGGRKRIAHLTDLHFGNVTPLALQRGAVALANAAAPDLVLLTGDFVARGLNHLDRLEHTLGQLEAPAIAVLGNHDYWLDHRAVLQALERAGVEVISNRWTRVGRGEDALALVCMDDYGTDHHDAHRSCANLLGEPALALSHNPEGAPLLWGRGAGLVLSGHTHAGQFFFNNVTRSLYQKLLGVNYLNGWYRADDHQVYVNPGVGSSVVPWRYGRPAMREVAIIDLEGGPISEPGIRLGAPSAPGGRAARSPRSPAPG